MDFNQDQAQEYLKQYGQVVAKAWADDNFKARLLADPAGTLQAEGIAVPTGVEIRAVENTDKIVYLAVPARPNENLSDEQLDQIAGGLTVGPSGSLASLASYGGSSGTVSSAMTVSSAITVGTAG